jgi:hypothetical protein
MKNQWMIYSEENMKEIVSDVTQEEIVEME